MSQNKSAAVKVAKEATLDATREDGGESETASRRNDPDR